MTRSIDGFRPGEPAELYTQATAAANPDPLPLEPVYQPARLTALPVALFLCTCYTTYQIGLMDYAHWVGPGQVDPKTLALGGLWYAGPLMLTLLCHEFGHFLQARRYHVPASWPYFIPVPFPPFGTMGAVIGMRGHMGNRKALFDIGISGPLAGLGPALLCCVVGLSMSRMIAVPNGGRGELGEPLLFQWLCNLMFGPRGPGQDIWLHPLAYAGWVGIFITALNLIPIGQLDGGHVLYALLRRKAHRVAQLLLLGALVAVVVTGNWGWSLMLMLLLYMGPNHPPTANDDMPLGTGRVILGWLTLLFIIIGFTPQPFL